MAGPQNEPLTRWEQLTLQQQTLVRDVLDEAERADTLDGILAGLQKAQDLINEFVAGRA